MYPNVVTKILLESAPNALFADIFIIFFGCAVTAILIVEVCACHLKYHQNSIKNFKILTYRWILQHEL